MQTLSLPSTGEILQIVQETIGAPRERIRVMPNAVGGSWMAGETRLPTSPRSFLFVGHQERREGMPEPCTAVRSLSDCEWRMDFVGPIPKEHRLRDSRVTYHGAIRDSVELLRVYDECDCIVCPSYAERMPTILIETMARGMAAIATDVGAVSELVTPESGLLPPDSAPHGHRERHESVGADAFRNPAHDEGRGAWHRMDWTAWRVFGLMQWQRLLGVEADRT